ncbi:hypothetical protein [Ehrlichia ruminantium]|uniref:hypothetical protein n=1 Tax=Ehrlichia ruminantium TaxID=779 RepID=UPI00124B437E|nr:hypothetical protein [Ehrlichia ruminantium]UOD99350.1 hypothetical protein IMW62_03070 [Ehrlichia ruminantium]
MLTSFLFSTIVTRRLCILSFALTFNEHTAFDCGSAFSIVCISDCSVDEIILANLFLRCDLVSHLGGSVLDDVSVLSVCLLGSVLSTCACNSSLVGVLT